MSKSKNEIKKEIPLEVKAKNGKMHTVGKVEVTASVPEKPAKKEPEIQTTWTVQINKFGDLHFRKPMLESLQVTSKIEALQNLTMKYLPGKIEIVAEGTKT
jgi:hypothetical protein